MLKVIKRLATLVVLWFVSCGPVFADDIITASKHYATGAENGGAHSWIVDITSKVDNLIIQIIVVNRGGCDTASVQFMENMSAKVPITLKFGQIYEIQTRDCNPIEVTVTTDLGTETVTWNQ